MDYTIKQYGERYPGDTETGDTDITYNGKRYKLLDPPFVQKALAGTEVEAIEDDFDGYEADWTATAGYEGNADNTVENNRVKGVVQGDGSLVLFVLYKPIEYRVYYHYRGIVPDGADPEEADVEDYDTDAHYAGETVTVKPDATAPAGYTFSGWETERIPVTAGTFTMPARDANLYGSFSANTDTKYWVIHYQE